jgi:hypothetical protein
MFFPSLWVRDQVWHPDKIGGRIAVLYTFILNFLVGDEKTNYSELNSSTHSLIFKTENNWNYRKATFVFFPETSHTINLFYHCWIITANQVAFLNFWWRASLPLTMLRALIYCSGDMKCEQQTLVNYTYVVCKTCVNLGGVIEALNFNLFLLSLLHAFDIISGRNHQHL